MTGLEIKYFAAPSSPAAARAEHIAAGEPAHKNKLVRLRDIKTLAVHLFDGYLNIFADALCYRVRGIDCPEALKIAVAPMQGAGGTHKALEGL